MHNLRKFWDSFYTAWKFLVREYEVVILLTAVVVAVLWLVVGNQ